MTPHETSAPISPVRRTTWPHRRIKNKNKNILWCHLPYGDVAKCDSPVQHHEQQNGCWSRGHSPMQIGNPLWLLTRPNEMYWQNKLRVSFSPRNYVLNTDLRFSHASHTGENNCGGYPGLVYSTTAKLFKYWHWNSFLEVDDLRRFNGLFLFPSWNRSWITAQFRSTRETDYSTNDTCRFAHHQHVLGLEPGWRSLVTSHVIFLSFLCS